MLKLTDLHDKSNKTVISTNLYKVDDDSIEYSNEGIFDIFKNIGTIISKKTEKISSSIKENSMISNQNLDDIEKKIIDLKSSVDRNKHPLRPRIEINDDVFKKLSKDYNTLNYVNDIKSLASIISENKYTDTSAFIYNSYILPIFSIVQKNKINLNGFEKSYDDILSNKLLSTDMLVTKFISASHPKYTLLDRTVSDISLISTETYLGCCRLRVDIVSVTASAKRIDSYLSLIDKATKNKLSRSVNALTPNDVIALLDASLYLLKQIKTYFRWLDNNKPTYDLAEDVTEDIWEYIHEQGITDVPPAIKVPPKAAKLLDIVQQQCIHISYNKSPVTQLATNGIDVVKAAYILANRCIVNLK